MVQCEPGRFLNYPKIPSIDSGEDNLFRGIIGRMCICPFRLAFVRDGGKKFQCFIFPAATKSHDYSHGLGLLAAATQLRRGTSGHWAAVLLPPGSCEASGLWRMSPAIATGPAVLHGSDGWSPRRRTAAALLHEDGEVANKLICSTSTRTANKLICSTSPPVTSRDHEKLSGNHGWNVSYRGYCW